MMLKVLCTAGPTSRYVADVNVKVGKTFSYLFWIKQKIAERDDGMLVIGI